MKQNIDILGLRSFVLAERLGSFTKAAGILNCSPGALSFRIKKLEQTLGVRLFHRNYHNLQLTSSGRNLLSEANLLLKAHDKMVASTRQIEMREVVKIGVPEDLTHRFFQQVMSRQNRAEETTGIELTMRLSRDLIDMTTDENLDMAIATVPPDFPGGEPLESTKLLWVAAPSFELERNRPIPLALHPVRCVYRDLITAVLEASGVDYQITFSAQGSMSVQAAVAAGIGVTVIAEGMVPPELVEAPEGWQLPDLGHIDIRLFKNTTLSPYKLKIVDTLKSAFGAA